MQIRTFAKLNVVHIYADLSAHADGGTSIGKRAVSRRMRAEPFWAALERGLSVVLVLHYGHDAWVPTSRSWPG
jgi:hypothetical protein